MPALEPLLELLLVPPLRGMPDEPAAAFAPLLPFVALPEPDVLPAAGVLPLLVVANARGVGGVNDGICGGEGGVGVVRITDCSLACGLFAGGQLCSSSVSSPCGGAS